MPKIKSKFLDQLYKDFKNRIKELQSAVDETEFLEGLLTMLETETKTRRERTSLAYARTIEVPWDVVKAWFLENYGPTDRFRVRELAEQFDKPTSWASRRTEKMVTEGLLETFGNGLYRRPPIHTGETARLHAGEGLIN